MKEKIFKKMGPPTKDPSNVNPGYLKYKSWHINYYKNNSEKIKQKQKNRRLAFNQTLPPLNLICEYCNKPFVLPGMNEKGHKQHGVKYCSGVCGDRAGRFRKLWIPKWLFNFYLDKKLFQLVAGIKLRKHWKLSEFRSRRIPIHRLYQKLKTLFISNCGHNPEIYQRIKTVFFHRTVTTEGKNTYKLKSLRRFLFGRERKNCLECGQSILHLAVDANYCNPVCYRKHRYETPPRPLFSRLIGKGPYITYKRYGLKKIIFTKRRFTKLKGIKMRIHIRIRILHYIIASPFINFYRFLFFKCRWCRIRLTGPVTQRFCNERCEDRYKRYSQRLLPLWFYRRFYTKYNLYKIRWQYYPRVKNHIKELVVHIIRFLKKKLKKSKTPYYIRKGPRLATCKHCQQTFDGKGFCSSYCRTLFEEAIVQRRKERNLVSWGTEERPDEETRKKIQRKKNAEWQRHKVKTDPGFKLIKMMRTRTKKVMKKYRIKGSSEFYAPLDLLKVLEIKDGDELRVHIEDQFTEGMSWSNHGQGLGKWVVDHHIPIKYWNDNFDLLNNLEIQKKCFGKYNLKPLWWVDNAHKSAKLNYEFKPSRR